MQRQQTIVQYERVALVDPDGPLRRFYKASRLTLLLYSLKQPTATVTIFPCLNRAVTCRPPPKFVWKSTRDRETKSQRRTLSSYLCVSRLAVQIPVRLLIEAIDNIGLIALRIDPMTFALWYMSRSLTQNIPQGKSRTCHSVR